MGAELSFVDRNVVLGAIGLSGTEASKALADFAREQLDATISSGEGTPRYVRYVDGRRDAREETVRPNGAIQYDFAVLAEMGAAALEWLRVNSPVLSGRYRDSHAIWLGGTKLGSADEVPADAASIMITNDQPYSRKIEVGSIRTSVSPLIYDHCRTAMLALYGAVVAVDLQYVDLPDGYVLRGRGKRRKGRRRGDAMTYPALIVTRR